MKKRNINSLVFFLLGIASYFFVDKYLLIESKETERSPKATVLSPPVVKQKTTKVDVINSVDINLENVTKEKQQQNKLLDETNELNQALADTPELKAFFEKQRAVDKARISRTFSSKKQYSTFFSNDEYDPAWANKVENEIDELAFDDNGQGIVDGMGLLNRECKKHFCKLSFSHDTADKQSIIEQQAKFAFSFSNKVDVNLHRNYSYFLDEETMQSYVFIERCLSCE